MDAGASPDMSGIRIEAITAAHIDSFHRTLDIVAREKKYLSMTEATPLPQTREFVMGMIAKGNPQFVAVTCEEVVGWCDISRHFFPSHAHRGNLGMGILPAYRGQGLGRRLMETTLRAAQKTGFRQSRTRCLRRQQPGDRSLRKIGLRARGHNPARCTHRRPVHRCDRHGAFVR
ncbi:GNAT superfamily N-acetyltransferase [Rhizobium lentis]|uniref:GNAT superfamily N-acetyltransferase n=1 Tax=Rhizobium lentis TaxID=1138194 RepID=A0A7W8XCT7_9HYPH|nr:GNAT superfamily N-acetyltransferase [Rhizobium lentis]MBB5548288.1 GNAT superfamily N-acetyltransferase [Rhizobium lentis]MBB5558816.1 GNAT superfamily N-acetyltransferase [Rhizobium lentis]MBB5565660.1 GNAT superfamily N-acetyltransferase [Rhizobium lentis]